MHSKQLEQANKQLWLRIKVRAVNIITFTLRLSSHISDRCFPAFFKRSQVQFCSPFRCKLLLKDAPQPDWNTFRTLFKKAGSKGIKFSYMWTEPKESLQSSQKKIQSRHPCLKNGHKDPVPSSPKPVFHQSLGPLRWYVNCGKLVVTSFGFPLCTCEPHCACWMVPQLSVTHNVSQKAAGKGGGDNFWCYHLGNPSRSASGYLSKPRTYSHQIN